MDDRRPPRRSIGFALAAIVVLFAAPASAQKQLSFITEAGVSSIGSADGTGSAARFFLPLGVTVDSAGNVYVADTNNATIRKITPAGVATTLAGRPTFNGNVNGTGSDALFSSPDGIVVDGSGNLYVTDSRNHAIRRITPAGVVSTFAGSPFGASGSIDGTGTAARFTQPLGI